MFRALWRRELAGSTGVGNAFAIPHARITGISEPLTAYVRLKTPLDFAAPDRKRVSELFVILVPAEGAAEAHLQLLALVAEAFSDRAFRARLATASDPEDVRSTFLQWIRARQAAQTLKGSYADGARDSPDQRLNCQRMSPMTTRSPATPKTQ